MLGMPLQLTETNEAMPKVAPTPLKSWAYRRIAVAVGEGGGGAGEGGIDGDGGGGLGGGGDGGWRQLRGRW